MLLKNQNNQNSQDLTNQINNFAEQLKSNGKDPQQLLQELINSGKYSNAEINNAKRKAEQFMKFFKK